MARKKVIRNSAGKWINSDVFREEAIRYLSKGYYTEAPYNSPQWVDYWKEQLRRCTEGYEVDGYKITGHHYCYLNFTKIDRVKLDDEDDGESLAEKEVNFPDFWDGDYNFFWALEIARNGICSKLTQVPHTEKQRKVWYECNKKMKNLEESSNEYKELKEKRDKISQEILDNLGLFVKPHLDYLNGGYHFIVGKARRRGYSFKNALVIANIYSTVRNKLTLLGAYDKKFMDATMEKVWEYIHFFNSETGFTKNRIIEKKDFIKSGFIENINGVNVEKGYKSRIDASRTFKDNPDAMRGVDGYFILFEEAGAFDNLADSFNATYPSLTAGSKMTGQICIIGTSGDLGKGSRDYAEMFYNPIAYGLMPFHNIWDKDSQNNVCGFFHPVTWNMEGFYDKQGNSNIEEATNWENKERKKILENSNSSNKLNQHIQEFPICPADAFSVTSFSIFPVQELRDRLNKLFAERLHIKKGIPVKLSYKEGKVITSPDLTGKLEPIWGYKPKSIDLSGCPVIYEFPSPNAPKNFYKIGYDPYIQDDGTSLASIIVFKGHLRGEKTKYKVVAEYYGRPQNADDVNRLAMMFAELYDTQIMVENNVNHPITFFERNKKLHLLASQPDNVISNSIKKSKVNRKYGCHMTDKIKEDCEKYVNNWLIEGYQDDYGNIYSTIDEIDSLGLLEELLQYNRKSNFDRMSALFMCMIQLQEQEINEVKSLNTTRISEVMDFLRRNLYGSKKI